MDGPGSSGRGPGSGGHGSASGGHGSGPGARGAGRGGESSVGPAHGASGVPFAEHQVTLRTPAELADALPYLLGYRPEDSIVLAALHDRDGRGRFGGRARLGIPANADDWASVARQLTEGLVKGSERRGAHPESMVAFLCQDPRGGESARDVMERLRPLAQFLRRACGALDVPVIEALCISDGRFWSYCCPSEQCCPSDGTPMGLPGTSVLAAAATYAGLQVRGSLREFRARLIPWETAAALEQESALNAVSMALIPRILDDESRTAVATETLDLAHRVMRRFADSTSAAGVPGVPGVSAVSPASALSGAAGVSGALSADLRDDELLGHDEAATLILGLQDRTTRDRAAEWMEGDEAGPALRLWRALARRCVGPYGEHAAAPLTLVGWVAWSSGDELEAREALAMALGADPGYLFARLLHQACNEGLDPESIRRCLRKERVDRADAEVIASLASSEHSESPVYADGPSGPASTSSTRAASRRRRKPRSTGSAVSRPGSRPSGSAGMRRPRSSADDSPAPEAPTRAGDSTGGATRSRRGAGRHGTKQGET
ncbi:DUF4192 domain-containing protein [Streptomyces liliifuscus]|uniref:DUF4192 domain-containing protein n=1 Tax=Streptomyces liliifuscus TaxID=2797636 RepID=A0A7T7I3R8_9ACTN|nr:DUF4192 domain-containing protein [Streptomyces liliifuscus]QQM40376.1 DUF4192 domain-containing protein [Streptomyces liliifuscus]